jgi:hypothetical protein
LKRRPLVAGVLVGLALGVSAPAAAATRADYPNDRRLRFDQLQLLGTHNSYHRRPGAPFDIGESTIEQPPLPEQLDEYGVRSVELDVHNAPTLPVFHTIVIDDRSSCPTLASCLTTIADWSRRHPAHAPLVVLLEPKDLPTSSNPAIQAVIDRTVAAERLTPWDALGLTRVDATVRTALGPSLVTPDEVRGRSRTVRREIVEHGWPTLDRMRGRVVVVLNTGGSTREQYLDGAPSLQGRAMFVTAEPDQPSAAVVKVDLPDRARIERLVRAHFVVRTRSDASGVEAHANDHTRATRAVASGAQVVSTDFPVPDPDVGPYEVRFTGGASVRCNPVTAPPWCRTRDVEWMPSSSPRPS